MIRGISRPVRLAAVLAVLSVVTISFSEGAEDAAVSAPAPKGVLTAGEKQIVVGGTVHLLLTISGGEGLKACVFEQPALPSLAHLDLLAVSQRNAFSFRSGVPVFTTSFLYALKARSPGVEKVPSIQVKYRDKGEGESRAVTAAGLEIEIGEGCGIGRRAIALSVLVVAGGALLCVAWRMRRR